VISGLFENWSLSLLIGDEMLLMGDEMAGLDLGVCAVSDFEVTERE
jgi:hypothetical protein